MAGSDGFGCFWLCLTPLVISPQHRICPSRSQPATSGCQNQIKAFRLCSLIGWSGKRCGYKKFFESLCTWQCSTNCSILPSQMGKHGDVDNMENMKRWKLSTRWPIKPSNYNSKQYNNDRKYSFFANQNTKNTERIRHYPLLCLCRKQLADYVSREKKVSVKYPISNKSFLLN